MGSFLTGVRSLTARPEGVVTWIILVRIYLTHVNACLTQHTVSGKDVEGGKGEGRDE